MRRSGVATGAGGHGAERLKQHSAPYAFAALRNDPSRTAGASCPHSIRAAGSLGRQSCFGKDAEGIGMTFDEAAE